MTEQPKQDQQKQPEAKQPEAKQPEAKQPEAKQPEAKQPEAKQPEAKQPSKAEDEKARRQHWADAIAAADDEIRQIREAIDELQSELRKAEQKRTELGHAREQEFPPMSNAKAFRAYTNQQDADRRARAQQMQALHAVLGEVSAVGPHKVDADRAANRPGQCGRAAAVPPVQPRK